MPSRPPAPDGVKFRVLVVEDDADIARLIMMTLTTAGFECRHAHDGATGLQAFHDSKPHLVVLDLMMPGMSGQEVCVKIREESTIPVVIMTALDGDADQMSGFKMGADDYIIKPFNPKLLAARVASNLRRAYRYDAPEEVATEQVAELTHSTTVLEEVQRYGSARGVISAPVKAEVPAGWASCDSCNYMGPRDRFQAEDAFGRVQLMCPNCKQAEFVVFSLG